MTVLHKKIRAIIVAELMEKIDNNFAPIEIAESITNKIEQLIKERTSP